jgi:hypothetical protein
MSEEELSFKMNFLSRLVGFPLEFIHSKGQEASFCPLKSKCATCCLLPATTAKVH